MAQASQVQAEEVEEPRSKEDVRENEFKYPDPNTPAYVEALLKELDK